jgi:hypothetical protein
MSTAERGVEVSEIVMPAGTGADAAEVFPAGVLGVVDVDGGPTEEQLAVLRAFVTHVWKRAAHTRSDPTTAPRPSNVSATAPA